MKDRRKKTNISNPKEVDKVSEKKQLSEEQRQHMFRVFGLFAGIVSKALLEQGGCVVDYKINGENITDIEKLHELDITERLKLAVKEERFEDAMNLKKILDGINNNQKKLPNNELRPEN